MPPRVNAGPRPLGSDAMKTRLARQALSEALTAVAAVTGGRTTKPILGCVRLEVSGTRLELCGTDGEVALRVGITTIASDRPGVAVLPTDRLLGIIRELDDVEVMLDADDKACTIRGDGSEFKIFGMSAADFPPVPQMTGEPELVLAGSELRRMVALTSYAAARESSRYAINGVLWDRRGKRLFMVATDGRRLARAGGTLREARGADFQLIVPSKALGVVERVFAPPKAEEDWTVEVRVLPNQIILRSGDRVIASALVEGNFPKYEDVIPKESSRHAKLETGEFHAAIRRAALLTTEDSRAVRLSFGPERLVITASSPEQGEARVEVPVQYTGEPLDIGFNPAFVADALKVLPYREVLIDMQESARPGVLSGGDANEFLYVLMPVALTP